MRMSLPVRLSIRVTPNAKKDCLEWKNGIIKCRLHAPAVDGKANEALLECFRKIPELPKRNITLIRGEKSREKIISIDGLNEEEIQIRIQRFQSK